jgi:anti-anti-sigma regulatory factor
MKSAGVDFHLYKPSTQVGKTLELVQLKNHFNTIDSERELEELL